MAPSQLSNSFILVLVISLICSLLLAFISTLLSMMSRSKFGIDRIFTSMPHLLLVNITLIIFISNPDYDLVTSIYSIPFGTMNSVIFIFIYCILSSLLSHSTVNHFVHHSIIIFISFVIWLLLSFILFRIIDLLLSNYPHVMIFDVHLSTIIIMGFICALFQFLIASSIVLAKTPSDNSSDMNQINHNENVSTNHQTYVIRGLFALIIIGICVWILTVNGYAILCGIICVFPSLHLSLDNISLRDTVITYFLESSSMNILALLVARFYLVSDVGILFSMLLAYVITMLCFVIPIHFCLMKRSKNNRKTHNVSYDSVEYDTYNSFSSIGDL